MTDGLKASQIKGGIRPSKSFDQGRVCKDESCSTQLSIYNKRDHCFNHRADRSVPFDLSRSRNGGSASDFDGAGDSLCRDPCCGC
jgi:hypothetical protein